MTGMPVRSAAPASGCCRSARRVSRDVAVFDQRSCLTGTMVHSRAFVQE
jgi:hypothetical protein